VVARRFPHALVLEDDAVLPDDLDELLGALPPHLDGREVALLYYRSFRECPLSGDGVRLPGDRLLADPLDPSLPIGGTAYAITREACEAMIELPHHEPDAWGQFVANGGIERLRCVHPRPVGERLDFASTLGYGGTLAQLVPAQLRTWRREWLERRMSRFPLAE